MWYLKSETITDVLDDLDVLDVLDVLALAESSGEKHEFEF